MATISTHNGSAVRQAHNLRTKSCVEKEPHIDPFGIHETWKHETIKNAYNRIFGDAVERYNAKQTREDRKITNYLEDVRADSRRHDCYEMIIGIYGDDVDNQKSKEIMKEFVNTWHERNPNLEMIGAYYHADEQGKNPHVHIDYIPVAHGYRRGMDTQNGLVKAFEEMGIQKNGRETAQIQWEAKENHYLDILCLENGIDVKHPQSKQENIKHLDTREYKAISRINDLEEKIAFLEKQQEIVLQRSESQLKHLENLNKSISIAKEQKLEALRERDAIMVEADVKKAVNEAIEPFKDKIYTYGIPKVLAETPEKPKTLFTEYKPATVTIVKDDFYDLARKITCLERTVQRAELAAERMERATEKYTDAADTIFQNKIDSYEVAVDCRVNQAEYERKRAIEYAKEKLEQAKKTNERLHNVEQENRALRSKIEGFTDIIKYQPKEWERFVRHSQQVKAEVERMMQPVHRQSQSWDLSR